MPISESQLTIWSHQGSIVNSSNTANSVKHAINSYSGFPSEVKFDVYLSGSYKNDTNIFGESDVDIVVQLNSFYHNLSLEQEAYLQFGTAKYGYTDFKTDVIKCLEAYYGAGYVTVGNKAIQVLPTNNNKLHADVLVCCSYRHYYNPSIVTAFTEGIAFYSKNNNQRIINYPRQHSHNDTLKHQKTAGYFKPTMRILKNIKAVLVNQGVISKSIAPSYFIECLLSNVPDENFETNYHTTVLNVLKYLNANNWDNFQCLNKLTPLWGTSSETWNQNDARTYVSSVIKKWNNP